MNKLKKMIDNLSSFQRVLIYTGISAIGWNLFVLSSEAGSVYLGYISLTICITPIWAIILLFIDYLFTYGKDWNIFKTESSNVDPDLFQKEARKVFKDIKKLQDEGVLPKELKTIGEVQDYINERKIIDEDEE